MLHPLSTDGHQFLLRREHSDTWTIVGIEPGDAKLTLPAYYLDRPITACTTTHLAHAPPIQHLHISDVCTDFSCENAHFPALTTLTVGEKNPRYRAVGGMLLSRDGSWLLRALAGGNTDTAVLPDCVQTIGPGAFQDSRCRNIVFPHHLRSIDPHAFDGSAFAAAQGPALLADQLLVYMQRSAYLLQLPPDTRGFVPGCFANHEPGALVTPILPPDLVLEHCRELTVYATAHSPAAVQPGVLRAWTRLQAIYINNNNNNIINNNINNIINLQYSCDGVLYDTAGTLLFYPSDRLETHYSVAEGTKTIAPGAFVAPAGLCTLTLPGSLRQLPVGCFAHCKSLQCVEIEPGLQRLPDAQRLYPGVFSDCTQLREVRLPPTLSYLGAGSFAGCIALQTLALPRSLQLIGPGALSSVQAVQVYAHTAAGLMQALYDPPPDRGARPWRSVQLTVLREDGSVSDTLTLPHALDPEGQQHIRHLWDQLHIDYSHLAASFAHMTDANERMNMALFALRHLPSSLHAPYQAYLVRTGLVCARRLEAQGRTDDYLFLLETLTDLAIHRLLRESAERDSPFVAYLLAEQNRRSAASPHPFPL